MAVSAWMLRLGLLAACVTGFCSNVDRICSGQIISELETDATTLLQVSRVYMAGDGRNPRHELRHGPVSAGLGGPGSPDLMLGPGQELTETEWPGSGACPPSALYLVSGQGDGTFWRCIEGSNCIRHKKRCDGLKDCGDGSDEVYCNKKLRKRVHDIESKHSELQDVVNSLRTGSAERRAEFNTLRATFHALNISLRKSFNVLESGTKPHFKLQTDLEVLKTRSSELQSQIDAVKTHTNQRQADENILLSNNLRLRAAVNSLKRENSVLQKEIGSLKDAYVKLQLALHPRPKSRHTRRFTGSQDQDRWSEHSKK